LAELRIFPTGQAWHKARALSAPADRLAMARLAFDGIAGAVVDAREIQRPGPTYTLDTLRELQQAQPGVQLVLIVGADQARSLPRWHGYEAILGTAIISVADRALPTGPCGPFDPGMLAPLPSGARFEQLQIRARAARGEDLDGLVPAAVARYIDRHHLYRPA
jgi:nicotinate-nucleotide adenylyltransferase